MTYIWNRADRVPEELRPQRLTKAFQRWSKEQYKELSKTTDAKRQKSILKTIVRQTEQYQDAVNASKLKNNNHQVI